MLTKQATKRSAVTFFALTLGLWGINFYLNGSEDYCTKLSNRETEGIEHGEKEKGADLAIEKGSEEFYRWFLNKTRSMSPTHLKLEGACPAVHASTYSSTDKPDMDQEYIGSIAILGEIHLILREDERTIKENVLRNLSDHLHDTSVVITSLSITLNEKSKTPRLLSDLRTLGSKFIVSLANTMLVHGSSNDDTVRKLTRILEWAGIDWLGVNAKKYHVVVLGARHGERFGVLAYCGVQKECTDKSNLAFYPIKYSQKAAKAAIDDLHQRGVTLVVVLMYWGLESSYFPDETALGIARYLSRLGVSAVIGYHPNFAHQHAYFGDMLVIFSPGKLISSSEVTHNCWKKSSGKWVYSSSKACRSIHPQNRNRLLTREHQSRIYKLRLSRSRPVVADYITLSTKDHRGENGHLTRAPKLHTASSTKWMRACSNSDTHCLSCIPF